MKKFLSFLLVLLLMFAFMKPHKTEATGCPMKAGFMILVLTALVMWPTLDAPHRMMVKRKLWEYRYILGSTTFTTVGGAYAYRYHYTSKKKKEAPVEGVDSRDEL